MPGDLIFVTKGSPGRVCLAPDPVNFCIAQDMVAIRADEKKVSPKYLFALLRSKTTKGMIENMHVGTMIPHFKKGDFDKLLLPIPDRETQEFVGDLYYDFSLRINLHREANATLESIAQAIFKSWFVDFGPVKDKAEGREPEGMDAETAALFPSEFEESELGLIPKGWRVTPFGELLEHTIGGDWGKDSQEAEHSVCVAIVRGTDMPDIKFGLIDGVPRRFVTPKKLESRRIVNGDIVIEVSGGSKTQSTGRSFYFSDNILQNFDTPVVPASFCRLLRARDNRVALILSIHLSVIYAAGKMWNYQVQSTGLANFQTTHFLASELVVIPPEAILSEFYSLVHPLIERQQTGEILNLASLRDTLLPRLMSGQLRVSEAEQQIAEVV